MSTANSDQKSVTGDCLTCSDTEETAVKSTCKKFCKKVWTSCSLIRQGLWKIAQMAQIGESHQTVRGSDYEIVKTEQELTLNEDYGSFKVKRILWTDQLLHIKEATDPKKNIYLLEHEAKVQGRKKTLVQSLKQFHAHFYWLYKKSMTHAMVCLQGLYLGNVKSFCP